MTSVTRILCVLVVVLTAACSSSEAEGGDVSSDRPALSSGKRSRSSSSSSSAAPSAAATAEATKIFQTRCTPCHGEQGQGVIGPNLTDEAWIHGTGELLHIYKTVSEGVPAKGMPSWRMQLSAVQVRELAAFVGTLRGKNLPGKAPEGVVASSR